MTASPHLLAQRSHWCGRPGWTAPVPQPPSSWSRPLSSFPFLSFPFLQFGGAVWQDLDKRVLEFWTRGFENTLLTLVRTSQFYARSKPDVGVTDFNADLIIYSGLGGFRWCAKLNGLSPVRSLIAVLLSCMSCMVIFHTSLLTWPKDTSLGVMHDHDLEDGPRL